MVSVRLWDTTLRDGEQAPKRRDGKSGLQLNEKVRVARLLEEIGVYTIEAGMPANEKHDDYAKVRAVAKAIKECEIAAFARARNDDIDLAARALEPSQRPVILTFTPAYKPKLDTLGWSLERGIEEATRAVEYAKTKVDEVAFGAEFSTKADPDYLIRLFQSVVDAGASRIVVADTTGYMLPSQFGGLVNRVHREVNGNYAVSVHCHNDLGLAIANPLAAIENGAVEVHVTAAGIGERAGNTALEQLTHALLVQGDSIDAVAQGIRYEKIVPNINEIAKIFGYEVPVNAPVIGPNAFATGAGIHAQAEHLYREVDCREVYGVEPRIVAGPHSGKFED